MAPGDHSEEQVEIVATHKRWMALQSERVIRARELLAGGADRDALIRGEFGFVCVLAAEGKSASGEAARGFVREERFGSGQVIAGTNRDKSRKIYQALRS